MIYINPDAIIISINGKFTEKIFNGSKDLEIRKRPPSANYPYKGFIYETKAIYKNSLGFKVCGEGAIVGEMIIGARLRTNIFACNPTTFKSSINPGSGTQYIDADGVLEYQEQLLKRACITRTELEKYGAVEDLHALVIKQARRYRKPLPLSYFGIKRAPQSWQYTNNIIIE